MAEKAFKELDVDGLYQVLEKELGAHIATVIQEEEISGEDFLDLTEDDVEKMFSKLGQRKKVLRLMKSKHVPTAQEPPSTGQNSSPLADQHSGAQAVAQTSPTSTTSYGTQVGISGKIVLEPPHTGESASANSAKGNPISSPVAQRHCAGNRLEHHKHEEMVRNLDKLSKDDLFLVLSEKVDQEAATAMKNNGICGSTLIDLNDTQLKELLPKSGPRMMVKRLIDSFQSAGPSQPKGAVCLQQTSPATGSVSLMVLTREKYPLISPATVTTKVQNTPPKGLGSQTESNVQGQHCLIPKAVVPPLAPKKRLALRVMEESECIDRDPQRIYKLKLKFVAEDKAKGVAKYRFGSPRPDSEEYVVMLVGATGAGKSTLINGVVNYILGVDWKDDFRFKLITDEGGAIQANSMTKCITAYTIPHQYGAPFAHTLTIVDTPGFGDTKGIESDKLIVDQIRAFFSMPGQRGIDHIHAIGFVTQASLARLTPTQRYVFDSILAVFGKDVGKNILMMTTFADAKKPPVLVAVNAAGIHYCNSFKFNNSALFADDEDASSDFNKMFWDMGVHSFAEFFQQLTCMEAISLRLTKEVLEERKQLEAIMQSLQPQIQEILGRIGTLQQEEHIMEQHEADIAANRNFRYTVTEPKIEKRQTKPGQHVTNCLKCNFTCHKDCVYANNEEKQYCSAMSGQNCRVCQNKCHWSSHVNNPFWFEVTEVTNVKTYDDLKRRYEAAMTGKATLEGVVSMIRTDVATRYHEVFLMTRKAQQILQRLDEIALRPNPLSEVEYINLLIQSEEREGRDGCMQRIECLKIVREQAQLLSTVKDDKIFESEALKKAQQLATAEAARGMAQNIAEAIRRGWFKRAVASTWSAITGN